MSVDIKIVNRGIFKKKPSMHDFLETGPQAGAMGSTQRMQSLEEEAAGNLILYDPSYIARSIQVVWKQPYEVEPYLLLSACRQEIEAFYALIQHLCKRWKMGAFGQGEETQELQGATGIKQRLITFNDECLDSFPKEYADGCFLSAVYPLWFEQQDHGETHGDFGAWPHNHQRQDVHYVVPRVYQKEDGFFGMYTVTFTVDSLLSIKPEAPSGVKDPVGGEDI